MAGISGDRGAGTNLNGSLVAAPPSYLGCADCGGLIESEYTWNGEKPDGSEDWITFSYCTECFRNAVS